MSLFVTALNSGSNGNCFYIGNDEEAVLIDVGISCRETERRMERLGLSMNKVKAVFITHEHSDHIRGLRVLTKKYKMSVYSTAGTLKDKHLSADTHYHAITPLMPVAIGELKITGFPKNHDAHDPLSFVVQYDETCVGVFTDIGAPCKHVMKYFQSCHAIFLETNYDPKMLASGTYPYHLKRRIAGELGHLSNQQALQLFCEHKPDFMTHVFLSHLSEHNNDPELVQSLFEERAGSTKVILTSRTSEIPIYTIDPELSRKPRLKPVQLSLFNRN